MKYVVLDFETYSACDLKKAGAWRYAEDPTTEIICIGLAFDGGEPEVIYPELYSGEGLLAFAVNDPAVIFVAHNAAFEKAVWRHVMVARYYWPDIPNGRWHDTMAVCAMKGLPLRLEKAASILRLPAKDTDGTRETLAYGRPGKDGNYRHGSEKLERIAAYCGQDVRVETDLHKTVRGPGTEERSTWLLDQTINERGVRIDRTLVAACRNIVEEASVPLAEEFRKITGLEKIGSPALLGWLKDRGVDLPNLQADTIDRALGAVEDDISNAGEDAVYNNLQELTGECRRILTIRKTLG
ncbi:MAG: hypothetical protein KGH93_03595, partial [Patescibacteria group bacterium]|nr:hypothetical protein [Patescibacteria group bacterium]